MCLAISCARRVPSRKKNIPRGISNKSHPFNGKISPRQQAAINPYNKKTEHSL
jgi:hypothetical protein